MSSEANKATSRKWYTEILSEGHLEVVDEICSANYRNNDPYSPPGGWPHGPEALKMVAQMYRTAFPNLIFTVEDQVAEGDRVATRWTARGTHQGPLNDIPPTGKSATVTGISIERYEDGKIIESYVNWDFMGLLQQIGVISMPDASIA
jgi:steroid delta-isomerase-like uncharacterized protein